MICGRLKLITATLMKKRTNIDHPTAGRKTMRLLMIELPRSTTKNAGMKAARNVKKTVHVGKLLRIAARGKFGAVRYQSENIPQCGALIRPTTIPNVKMNAN